jgi:PEP-CTERM motif
MSCRTITRRLGLASLAAAAAGMLAVTTAQAVSVSVVNQGFELPGTAKTLFFTGGAPNALIPGWTASGPGVQGGSGDSGVESDATYGLWAGYLGAQDPSIFQTTSYNIQAGQSFTLTYALNDSYTSDANFTQILNQAYATATLYYLSGATRVPLGSAQVGPFGYGYADHTVTASVVAAAIGKPIGIELDNVSNVFGAGVVNSWVHFDNIRLDATPEPATIALLAIGGVGLAVLVRRRS